MKQTLAFFFAGIITVSGWAEEASGTYSSKQSTPQFQGHSYLLSPKKRNWQMAKRDAESQGGYLVVINSSEEQTFIEKILLEASRKENYKEPVWMPRPIAMNSEMVSTFVRWLSKANPMAAPKPGAVQGVATAVASTPDRNAPQDPDD